MTQQDLGLAYKPLPGMKDGDRPNRACVCVRACRRGRQKGRSDDTCHRRTQPHVCVCVCVCAGVVGRAARVAAPLHYITLHCITLYYITLHYINSMYMSTELREWLLHYITLHYITLHNITLTACPCRPSCASGCSIALHYITLHYITLHYIDCMSMSAELREWLLQPSADAATILARQETDGTRETTRDDREPTSTAPPPPFAAHARPAPPRPAPRTPTPAASRGETTTTRDEPLPPTLLLLVLSAHPAPPRLLRPPPHVPYSSRARP